MKNKGEIIIYQPEKTLQIEVRLEDETVWLSLNQIAELFDRDKSVISRHIKNIFDEKELDKESVVAKNATTGPDNKTYQIDYYNLDVIISVGYRVKSKRGTQFRQWANRVLKEYLLKGYSINQRIERIENKILEHDQKIDFFVKTSLPPVEGIFFDGQIFDAYQFAANLIRSATKSIILIDNYIDENVLMLLTKRSPQATVIIYTGQISRQLSLDIQRHNAQYPPIDVRLFKQSHDRFLIIDKKEVFHIGASLKDLGKKWFAFSQLNIDPNLILQQII